jgi:hypothetical protein
VLNEFDVEDLLRGVTMLDQASNKLVIHPGLYEDAVHKDSLQIFTLAGGLSLSEDMIKSLVGRARIEEPTAIGKLADLFKH